MKNNLPISLVNALTSNSIDHSNLSTQEVLVSKPINSDSSFSNSFSVLLSPSVSQFKLNFTVKQFIKHFYLLKNNKQLSQAISLSSSLNIPLVSVLESRLDILVFRLSLASSVSHARSLIRGGFILVDHSPILSPHFIVQPGSIISSSSLDSYSSSLFSLLRPLPQHLFSLSPSEGLLSSSPLLEDLSFPSI